MQEYVYVDMKIKDYPLELTCILAGMCYNDTTLLKKERVKIEAYSTNQ